MIRKNTHPDLVAIQHWMQSLITNPGGIENGLSASAQENSQVQATTDEIINPSLQMTSSERLAIYANAYHARLIECLSADFPIFRQAVGDDAFAAFAVNYLHHHPSASYTLGDLGAHFPDFLTATRPSLDPAENPSEAALDWPDFLVDLAHLERALFEVFDGPGLEREPALPAADLAAINPSDWAELRLTFAPCVRLLAFNFPVNDYYTAQKIAGREDAAEIDNDAVAPPSPKKSWLAITRRNYIVRRYELTEPQFILLSALTAGQSLGEAISQTAESYPGDLGQLSTDLQTWFQVWTAAPMFAVISH